MAYFENPNNQYHILSNIYTTGLTQAFFSDPTNSYHVLRNVYNPTANGLNINLVDASGNTLDIITATGGTINGDLIINGDLTVTGTSYQTDIEVVTLYVEDNTIVLNNGETSAGVSEGVSGIIVDRGSLSDSYILFNENGTEPFFEKGISGGTHMKEIFKTNSVEFDTNKPLIINAQSTPSLYVDGSTIYTTNNDVVLNYQNQNKDFTINKSGTGTAYVYDASIDRHTYTSNIVYTDGATVVSQTIDPTNGEISYVTNDGSGFVWSLDASKKLRIFSAGVYSYVDFFNIGHAYFNAAYLDKNFVINKNVSGAAYVYDAGDDTSTFYSKTHIYYTGATTGSNTYFTIDDAGENSFNISTNRQFNTLTMWTDSTTSMYLSPKGSANVIMDGTVKVLKPFTANQNAIDADFTINKSGTGTAYMYDAGTDEHKYASQMHVGNTSPEYTSYLTVQSTSNDDGLRINGAGLYGSYGKLNFGDLDFCVIHEESDDNLSIHSSDNLTLSTDYGSIKFCQRDSYDDTINSAITFDFGAVSGGGAMISMDYFTSTPSSDAGDFYFEQSGSTTYFCYNKDGAIKRTELA